MKLKTLFKKAKIQPEIVAEQGHSPETPAPPAPTPPLDIGKIQALGQRLIEAAIQNGENPEGVLENLVTSYEEGQSAGVEAKPAPDPTQSIQGIDGIAQTLSAVADMFKASEELKQSVAETILPEGAAQESSFLEDLTQLGIGAPEVKMFMAKFMESKTTPGVNRNYG